MNLVLIGPAFEPIGYALVVRTLALMLSQQGFNIRLIPQRWGGIPLPEDPALQKLREMTDPSRPYGDVVLFAGLGSDAIRHPGRYRICLTMLESDRITQEWVTSLNSMDEVWVPSTFNARTFSESGVDPDKIHVMPLGVDSQTFRPEGPKMDIPGAKGFNFLSVFEWVPRKGWDILLRAFFSEFGADEDVALVLKVQNYCGLDPEGSQVRADIDRIREEVRNATGKQEFPTVIQIKDVLPDREMPNLYRACQAFVLPSKGEGWSFPIAEAMATGLPVICTRWSAYLDFLNDNNAYLINVAGFEDIAKYGVSCRIVYGDGRWAVPDENHLRRLMRHVFEHRDEAISRGALAREAAERITWEAAIERMKARLLAAKTKLAKRDQGQVFEFISRTVYTTDGGGKKKWEFVRKKT